MGFSLADLPIRVCNLRLWGAVLLLRRCQGQPHVRTSARYSSELHTDVWEHGLVDIVRMYVQGSMFRYACMCVHASILVYDMHLHRYIYIYIYQSAGRYTLARLPFAYRARDIRTASCRRKAGVGRPTRSSHRSSCNKG